MFRTIKEAEVSFPVELTEGDGSQYWEYLTFSLQCPWFYVSYENKQPAPQLSSLLISDIHQLLDLLSNLNDHVKQVYLVSPWHMNESSLWEMNQIKYILEGNEPEPNHEQSAYVYVLTNNKRLVDSSLGTKENNLLDVRLLRKFAPISM